MKGKVQLLTLITGLLLYLCDVGSDLYVTIQYYRTGQWWWFGLTLTFIILPIIIINITAFVQTVINEEKEEKNVACVLVCFCSCSSIVYRYLEEFMRWKRKYLDNSPCGQNCRSSTCEHCKSYLDQKRKSARSTYNLALLRYIETVTESTPQWCLQVYIMLRQWYFPWYTVLSTAFSLSSLSWSITALEKARQKKDENRNFKLISTVVFLIWQLSTLVSRLFAIVYCAYVLRHYVFIFIGVHWLLAAIILARGDLEMKFHACSDIVMGVLLSFTGAFFFLFFATVTVDISKFTIVSINFLLAFQNILMLILSLTVSKFDAPNTNEVKPIAISCVLGGLVIGTLFCLLYYKLCLPSQSERTDDNPAASFIENNGVENDSY